MTTPAKKLVRVSSYSGTSHVSFARFGSRNATRSLVGQSGIFLKMQLQGESWENLGELGKAAEICGDLWGFVGAVEGLQRGMGIVGVSSAPHEIKRKRTGM